MFPPLGVMYLSAYLKIYGLTAQCLDLSLEDHHPEMAESDIIGLSFTTPQREEAYKLAAFYKSIGKTVIAGGVHPTHKKVECLGNNIDKVLKGYGEIPLMQYLIGGKFHENNLYGGNTKGLFTPFPDRDALPIKKYYQEIEGRPSTPIIASRGCFFKCSFCSKIK
jgi:Fe-S oxidoreductase